MSWGIKNNSYLDFPPVILHKDGTTLDVYPAEIFKSP